MLDELMALDVLLFPIDGITVVAGGSPLDYDAAVFDCFSAY